MKKHDDEYRAMEPKDKNAKRSLVLRLASGETVHLKYTDIHLKRVAPDQTAMAIFAYGVNIIFYGQHLGMVAYGMDSEHTGWVQEFDPARWKMPTDPHSPIVERIELYVKKDGKPEDGDMVAEGVELERRAKH
jgi:hypothetical protein